jgi:hypothetical protein
MVKIVDMEMFVDLSTEIIIHYNLRIHNVFHDSLLKTYIHDPPHMIDWNLVQVEPKGEF